MIMMQTRRGESNIFRALMRREINCRGPDDRNLLLSYAEESTIMSCEQGKVRVKCVFIFRLEATSNVVSALCY